jgi:hypothetical protein
VFDQNPVEDAYKLENFKNLLESI